MLSEAIRLMENRSGREDPAIGESLAVMAEAALAQGMYAEAEETAREALAILERALGMEHLGLSHALQVLAYVTARLGQSQEALAHAQRGLALATKVGNEVAAQPFRELIAQLSTTPS